jgi:hypothetical protein
MSESRKRMKSKFRKKMKRISKFRKRMKKKMMNPQTKRKINLIKVDIFMSHMAWRLPLNMIIEEGESNN